MGYTSFLDGTWVSSSRISGSADVALTCEGADCEASGMSTACSASGEYEAILQEE